MFLATVKNASAAPRASGRSSWWRRYSSRCVKLLAWPRALLRFFLSAGWAMLRSVWLCIDYPDTPVRSGTFADEAATPLISLIAEKFCHTFRVVYGFGVKACRECCQYTSSNCMSLRTTPTSPLLQSTVRGGGGLPQQRRQGRLWSLVVPVVVDSVRPTVTSSCQNNICGIIELVANAAVYVLRLPELKLMRECILPLLG